MAIRLERYVGGAATGPPQEAQAQPSPYLPLTTASRGERGTAVALGVLSLIVMLITAPFATTALPELPGFVPIWGAAQFITALVTAVLLLGQFLSVRSLGLLALAAGYFLVALLIVPYLAAFPGVLSATGGVIGTPQTPAWLYAAWHLGLPAAIIGYVLLGDRRSGTRRPGLVAAMWAVAVVALAAVITFAATTDRLLDLPPLLQGPVKTPAGNAVFTVAWLSSLVALAILWRRGFRTGLDVWIGVVLVALICDVAISSVFNAARFDLGYYIGRIYGFLATSFVLGIILVEMTAAHARVVDSAARLSREVEEGRKRQRRAEEQLRQAQKLESLGELTGGLAHDFNNLLSIVVGNLDILVAQKKDDLAVRELGTEALEAAVRGADITRRLLAFARRQPLNPESIDVNDLITEVTGILSRTAGNVEFVLDLAPNLWPAVADPAQLHAAIVNLANNAREAMPRGGSIVVVTANYHLDEADAAANVGAVAGDYVMIEIGDTGTGMSPELLQRAFEPFFTTKDADRASGLGLSMVYGFVKQSGGYLAAVSEPGIGTTLRLFLPRDAAHQPAKRLPMMDLATVSGRNEHVLVVEDNALLRRVVVRQLHELHYRVSQADTAHGAIQVLEREDVDLLFTDLVMPGSMSGADLARSAAGRWPHLKVVVTSTFTETPAGAAPANPLPGRVITKPYRKVDLARVLREALEG